jgi:hypothetical protein
MGWRNFKSSVDKNQSEIVNNLRKIGASVWIVNGILDIVVGFQHKTYIFEIKNPTANNPDLQDSQIKFIEEWKGSPVYIIETFEDALQIINGNIPKAKCHDHYLSKKQKTRQKNIKNKANQKS